MKRKIEIPRENKFFLGVSEAIGNYFNLDSNIIRCIIIALFMFFPIKVILMYILSWIILPRESSSNIDDEEMEVEDDKFTEIITEDNMEYPSVNEVIIEENLNEDNVDLENIVIPDLDLDD